MKDKDITELIEIETPTDALFLLLLFMIASSIGITLFITSSIGISIGITLFISREFISDSLLRKARQSLNAAKDLLNLGYLDFSASRSYYAMFYAAEAVLLKKNLAFPKHKTVISSFGKEFIKTGVFPSVLGQYISKAFDIRLAGDYGVRVDSVNKERAELLVEQAEKFIVVIEKYLRRTWGKRFFGKR